MQPITVNGAMYRSAILDTLSTADGPLKWNALVDELGIADPDRLEQAIQGLIDANRVELRMPACEYALTREPPVSTCAACGEELVTGEHREILTSSSA